MLLLLGVIVILIAGYLLSSSRSKQRKPVVEIVDADDLFKRGMVDIRKCDYDRAIVNFSRALGVNPHYTPAFYHRGLAYLAKGEYDRAIADFNKALELSPKLALAMASMGRAYHLKGNKDRAKMWYERALEFSEQISVEEAGLVRKRLEELKTGDN